MELKEFIKSVLVDICAAVYEARNSVKESSIAPGNINGERVENGQLVNFEISVSVSDAIEGSGNGKIQVLSLGANAGAKVNKEMMNVNKISFQVPVY